MDERIRLGISTCLLGERVRYDGGHKLDRFLRDTLGRYVDYVPVCPEVECGLPTPREALRLVGDPAHPRLVTSRSGHDVTERMEAWARRRAAELANEDLHGFIFKSRSPSSGMERVKVYNDKGVPARTGVGVFARIFIKRFPLLPVEEEGRLHDLPLRENFIERLFTLRRWRDAIASGRRRSTLVRFHAAHKLLLMAHSPRMLTEAGRLVAQAKACKPAELFGRYHGLLMRAMRLKATTKKHANVLQHAMGYFKRLLTPDEKQELLEVIDRYRREVVPLIVPVTLLSHHVRKYAPAYLRDQVYLNPHPVELQLRNHV